MGIRLVVEVLDCYHGPDVKKLWLLSFAEKASDRTRQGWPGRDLLAHRTGKSRSRVSHLATELISDGVLKRTGGGGRHRGETRYELLPLAVPGDIQGAPRTNPDGVSQGSPRAHPENSSQSAPRAHSKPEVKGAESASQGAESGPQGAAISPLPAETPYNPQNPHEPSKVGPADDIEEILGDPGRGSPNRSRKTADLAGDRPVPVDVAAVPPAAASAAENMLRELAGGEPVPDGYAARVAAVILGGRRVGTPARYVMTAINQHPDRYWPPKGTP